MQWSLAKMRFAGFSRLHHRTATSHEAGFVQRSVQDGILSEVLGNRLLGHTDKQIAETIYKRLGALLIY